MDQNKLDTTDSKMTNKETSLGVKTAPDAPNIAKNNKKPLFIVFAIIILVAVLSAATYAYMNKRESKNEKKARDETVNISPEQYNEQNKKEYLEGISGVSLPENPTNDDKLELFEVQMIVYFESGDYARAITSAKDILVIDPVNITALTTLADAYEKTNNSMAKGVNQQRINYYNQYPDQITPDRLAEIKAKL